MWVREFISTDSSFFDIIVGKQPFPIIGKVMARVHHHCTRQEDVSKIVIVLKQVSDVIDMKEEGLNPTVLTMMLSEERGRVYQFQTAHDLAVFR